MAILNPSRLKEEAQKHSTMSLNGASVTLAPAANPPKASQTENEEVAPHGIERADLIRIAFVALAAAAVWFRVWEPFPRLSIIGLLATLIGGYPIFKEAVENIFQSRMTMELSMTIALLSALAIGEFFTALIIALFVLIAEVLEGLTMSRGRRAIKDLLDLLPQEVVVRRGGGTQEMSASEMRVGDVVIVRPGARLPVERDLHFTADKTLSAYAEEASRLGHIKA